MRVPRKYSVSAVGHDGLLPIHFALRQAELLATRFFVNPSWPTALTRPANWGNEMANESNLSVGTCVTLACLWEVTAPKPGNVHRGADFEDLTFLDFVTSAAVIGPIFEQASSLGVGATVLEAVRATRQAVGTNTNLGTILLLAPLASVRLKPVPLKPVPLKRALAGVLSNLTARDTAFVYEAIRLASAGGMGRVEEADVHDNAPPALDLVSAMRMAADRDLIARQYTNGFQEVLDASADWIAEGLARGWALGDAIVHAQMRLLAMWPDSLIARKCGKEVAQQASDWANGVLSSGSPGEEAYQKALASFDFWLRADGHRRNPGTTADLIAAGLFVLLREDRIDWPVTLANS